MDKLVGYRTIISAGLSFAVTLGVISIDEADGLTNGLMGVMAFGTLVSTIYFRLKANTGKKAM